MRRSFFSSSKVLIISLLLCRLSEQAENVNDMFLKVQLRFMIIDIINSLHLFSKQKSKKYAKFKRVQCDSSGKTCKGIFCNVKLVSRNLSLMNFGCKEGLTRILKRPLVKIETESNSNFAKFNKFQYSFTDECALLVQITNFSKLQNYN